MLLNFSSIIDRFIMEDTIAIHFVLQPPKQMANFHEVLGEHFQHFYFCSLTLKTMCLLSPLKPSLRFVFKK